MTPKPPVPSRQVPDIDIPDDHDTEGSTEDGRDTSRFTRFYGGKRIKGRPPGRKNDKTLLLKAEHEAFQQLVLQNLKPLFDAQLTLAKGVTVIYRVAEGVRGGRGDPELVTDPEEIHHAIQAIDPGTGPLSVAQGWGLSFWPEGKVDECPLLRRCWRTSGHPTGSPTL
jgi:hypothetical protein